MNLVFFVDEFLALKAVFKFQNQFVQSLSFIAALQYALILVLIDWKHLDKVAWAFIVSKIL